MERNRGKQRERKKKRTQLRVHNNLSVPVYMCVPISTCQPIPNNLHELYILSLSIYLSVWFTCLCNSVAFYIFQSVYIFISQSHMCEVSSLNLIIIIQFICCSKIIFNSTTTIIIYPVSIYLSVIHVSL